MRPDLRPLAEALIQAIAALPAQRRYKPLCDLRDLTQAHAKNRQAGDIRAKISNVIREIDAPSYRQHEDGGRPSTPGGTPGGHPENARAGVPPPNNIPGPNTETDTVEDPNSPQSSPLLKSHLLMPCPSCLRRGPNGAEYRVSPDPDGSGLLCVSCVYCGLVVGVVQGDITAGPGQVPDRPKPWGDHLELAEALHRELKKAAPKSGQGMPSWTSDMWADMDDNDRVLLSLACQGLFDTLEHHWPSKTPRVVRGQSGDERELVCPPCAGTGVVPRALKYPLSFFMQRTLGSRMKRKRMGFGVPDHDGPKPLLPQDWGFEEIRDVETTAGWLSIVHRGPDSEVLLQFDERLQCELTRVPVAPDYRETRILWPMNVSSYEEARIPAMVRRLHSPRVLAFDLLSTERFPTRLQMEKSLLQQRKESGSPIGTEGARRLKELSRMQLPPSVFDDQGRPDFEGLGAGCRVTCVATGITVQHDEAPQFSQNRVRCEEELEQLLKAHIDAVRAEQAKQVTALREDAHAEDNQEAPDMEPAPVRVC